MNYKKIYERIIDRARSRDLLSYKERHHIIPRCLGGSDDISNLVDLTPEEHYVCHQLLVKIHSKVNLPQQKV
jgi:5-methylcytosine-specific restriction endonuclease McrA